MDTTTNPPQAKRDIPINLFRPQAPLAMTLVAKRRLTPADHPSDVQHLVLRYAEGSFRYLEGQSIGVLPPGTNEAGKPHQLRLYSVASKRQGDDGKGDTVSLCVKRVRYTDPETGEERLGVATTYLCDLEPGAEIQTTGPVGRTFLLPEDPAIPLIMIATGTGIAPFRAFWEQLSATQAATEAWLFFGVPTTPELLYHDELKPLADAGALKLSLAISREQQTADGKRLYVQHRLAEHADALWPLIADKQAVVYMCGIKGMEKGVEEAFAAMAQRHGVDWEAMLPVLKKAHRWHAETY
jgi:ferredoxin--NADP+ reductase